MADQPVCNAALLLPGMAGPEEDEELNTQLQTAMTDVFGDSDSDQAYAPPSDSQSGSDSENQPPMRLRKQALARKVQPNLRCSDPITKIDFFWR